MHRGENNRWTSSQAPSAPAGSGSYSPHADAPPSPPKPPPAAAARALRTFLIALAGLLAANAALNAALNPSGELRDGGLLIESVLSSESHQKVEALRRFIARRAGAPMGVVLGSSRVLELSLADSAGVSYYNCGISGARAEDILAFTRFILAHPDAHLAEAVIGVDPLALAIEDDSVVYGARLRGVYLLERQMRDRLPLRERLEWRAAALLGRDWSTALREIDDPPVKQWFDSSGIYPESNYERRIGTTASARERYLTQHIAMVTTHLPPSTASDHRRVEDMTEAVRLLRAKGTRVTLFLPPTHPRLLAALRRDTIFLAQIKHVRATLRELASRTGATFADLTDPSATGLAPDDFWDGYHYRAAASPLVVRALAGSR